MKTVASIFALVTSLSSLLAAQSPKPLKTIDLNRVKIAGPECDSKWQDGNSQMIWVSEQSFVVFSTSAPCSNVVPSSKSAIVVVVLDSTGSVQATARRDDLIALSGGPRGTIAGLGWGNIELLDTQLRPEQRLDCPNRSQPCAITLAPSSAFGSEFAVCSSADAEQVCDFYRGWPAEKSSSDNTAISNAENPYTHVAGDGHANWRVGPEEVWSFNNGKLIRTGDVKASPLVSPEDFVGKNGGGCGGQLSTLEPRRFLAVCTGAHWYSDGMFDAIFGFSRVVLFDVPSARIIMRIDGPAYTSAALSPLGKRVATLRGSKIRLYEVD